MKTPNTLVYLNDKNKVKAFPIPESSKNVLEIASNYMKSVGGFFIGIIKKNPEDIKDKDICDMVKDSYDIELDSVKSL